ncbi:DNA polymerase III chi subunit [hydrothermal vent metagenome]|uniref:DNA polymerase III chi subunit n=1 Tax=hydrothermal vent metagenome TaxID=652676 RepID=A0A3B0ZD38_9ZZZZ
MTRIDFYISPNQDTEANLLLACRIAEKAYSKKNRVYVHVQDRQQAKRLDDLLWIFRDGSFVPHCQSTAEHIAQAAVVIGCDDLPEITPDVLINLADEVPNFFTRFERVAEIVSGTEPARNIARSHFKFYRERGYPLETHELNS